jgi:nitroreductase
MDVLSMDVFECIKGRRSIRRFKKEDVSEELVERVLAAARMAPSAGNMQDWSFIVIRDEKMKKELAEAAHKQFFLAAAPIVIVYLVDYRRSSTSYGKRGKELYALQDSGAAIQNLLLAAHALELGTCWVGAFDEEIVHKLVGAPRDYRPVAIIPLGYPATKPPMTRRRDLTDIVSYEQFMG